MNRKIFLSAGIIILSLFVSYVVLAQSPDVPSGLQLNSGVVSRGGIVFPIPELGNCGSKEECRTYCNEAVNIPACVKFAEAHGLMNKDEATRAEKFAERVRSGATPGGCNSPKSCEAFCSDIKNIETCVAFAEEHGFKDDKYKEGKKIADYIKSGGELPGGCTSRESCETYCRALDHMEECFAFADKVGIGPASAPGQFGKDEKKPKPEEVKKFVELAKNGETPGGCKSREECDVYCREEGHFNECVDFGKRVGFIGADQTELLKSTGGKGPGACNSKESCGAYCDDQTHREECFKFAEDRGLLSPEEIKQTKEGLVRLRQGLEQAPPEVAECLKSTLGQKIIEDIQSGNLTPGPAIGDRVKVCFEKFGERHDPQEIFRNAPPEAIACLKQKFGDKFESLRSGKTEFTPELGDVFRVCFEQVKLNQQSQDGSNTMNRLDGYMRSAPPAVQACIKEKFGSDLERIRSGELKLTDDFIIKIKSCFEQFRPQEFMGPPIREGSSVPPMVTYDFENLPADVLSCMRTRLSDEDINKAADEGVMTPAFAESVKYCYSLRAPMPPPTTAAPKFPPEVISCLKNNLSEEQIQILLSGRVPSLEIQEIIKKCFANVTLPQPTNISPYPTGTQICAQVITPAKDPITGACKDFPTPCNVPAGWQKVVSCSNSGTLYQAPTYDSNVAPSTNYVQPYNICPDAETCKKNCTDVSGVYYNNEVCVKIRSVLQSSYDYKGGDGFGNLLGSVLGPFLNFLAN